MGKPKKAAGLRALGTRGATLESRLSTTIADAPSASRIGADGKVVYGSRWQKVRATWLAKPENALCRACGNQGRVTASKVVDHVIPHRGDMGLFWRTSNWQPLCYSCHGAKSRAERE